MTTGEKSVHLLYGDKQPRFVFPGTYNGDIKPRSEFNLGRTALEPRVTPVGGGSGAFYATCRKV